MPDRIDQERTISGKGVFRLNDDFRECKRIILYASVIRPPKRPYLNLSWNPGRGFYANVTLSYQDFVGIDLAMNFPEQMFIIHQNDSQQLGAALVCHLQVVSNGLIRVGTLVGGNFELENPIKDFAYSAFIYEQAKFVCYSGTAISLRIVGEKTEKCDEADAPSSRPPSPPPPTQPYTDPDIPVQVSDPYPNESPDNPDTLPDIIDRPPPPPELPFGEPCTLYNVRAIFVRSDGLKIDQTLQVSGRVIEIDYVVSNDGTNSVSYGVVGEQLNQLTQVCDERYRVQFVSSPDGVDFYIVSIEPV